MGQKENQFDLAYLVLIQDELREADHVRDGPGFVDGRPPRLLVHPVPVKNQPRRCLKVHRVKNVFPGYLPLTRLLNFESFKLGTLWLLFNSE